MDQTGRRLEMALCRLVDEPCIHPDTFSAEIRQGLATLNRDCDRGKGLKGCLENGFKQHQIDPAHAFSFWRAECVGNGDIRNCTNLGLLYWSGLGVEENVTHASALYSQSCALGDANGCAHLGFSYWQGRGVQTSLGKARHYFQRSCGPGTVLGCVGLGILYETGLGTDVDLGRAASLYRQACEGGNKWGCSYLWFLYDRDLREGEGLT